MNSTWENILIAIVGAVLGVLTTVFGDEIKGWLGFSGYANRDLRGSWDCTWLIDWPAHQVREIADTVTIRRAAKREILARGLVEDHPYELRGSLSQANVLTLTYEITKMRNLSGTVIVRLSVTRTQFDGYWFQLHPSGEFCGGRTSWTEGLANMRLKLARQTVRTIRMPRCAA